MQPTLQDVIDLAQHAGAILQAGIGTNLNIRHKGRIDLVTEMDKRSEDFLLGEISKRFPGHAILSEESGYHQGHADHCWHLDPLDGTANYAHGIPIYCVSIAYAEKQRTKLAAVYDPTRPECFSAERGKGAWLNGKPIHVTDITELVDSILVTGFPYHTETWLNNLDNFARFFYEARSVRRFGSAALDLCYVAAGRAEGYWQVESHAWDIAAGALLVEEAGGMVTSIDGDPDYFKEPFCVVAANPHIHPKMLEVLKQK